MKRKIIRRLQNQRAKKAQQPKEKNQTTPENVEPLDTLPDEEPLRDAVLEDGYEKRRKFVADNSSLSISELISKLPEYSEFDRVKTSCD